MTDFATLVLGADTSGLKKGEAALDSIAAKGAAVESKVGASLNRTGQAATNMGAAAVGSSGNMRMLTQQLSQVGQMGAVTGNYLGALAVQLPDMGLAFGAAGAIIGTVAGVALPTLIAALGGTSTAAKAAQDAVAGVSEASAAYVAAVKAAAISSDELKARFGSLGAEARLALQAIADVKLVENIDKANAAIEKVSASLTAVSIANARSGATVQVLADNFGLAADDASKLLAGIQALERADGFKGQALAAADLRQQMMGVYGSVEAMPGPLQQAYKALGEITVSTAETQAATKDTATAYLDMYSAAVATNGPASQLSGLLAAAGNTAAGAAHNMWSMAQAAQAAINAASLSARKIPGMANPDPNAPIDLAKEAKAVENALEGMAYKAKLAERKLGGGGGGGGGLSDAAKDAAKELEKTEKAAEQLKEELQRPMVTAVEGVSDAFGDFVANGLKDFQSFKDSIVSSFRGMISDMISYALKNKIMMSMGLTTGMSPGFAAAAESGTAPNLLSILTGGGGAEGGATGGLGGLIGGLTGGFGDVVGGLLDGGLSGAGTALTEALGGISGGGLAGLGTAIGALGAVAAGIGLVASFFKTKKTLLDAGFKLTVKGMDTLVQTFQTIEKKKFWGLSKSVSTDLVKAEKAIADPIERAIFRIQKSVLKNAAAIGVSEKVFAKFRKSIAFSTKDLSQEQIAQRLQQRLQGLGNAFAGMVPGLRSMRAGGEQLMDTLARVALQLRTVNQAWRVLGFDLESVSLKGAKAADQIVKIFGNVQKFAQATAFYFDNFYTDQEKINLLRKRLNAGFDKAGVGAKLPKSVEEYRALIDRLESQGRDKAAAMLIKLAPLFVELQGALGGVADEVETLKDALDPNDFATLFDYQKSAALLANGVIKRAPRPVNYSGPARVVDGEAVQSRTGQTDILLTETLSAIQRFTKIIAKWDNVGIPIGEAI